MKRLLLILLVSALYACRSVDNRAIYVQNKTSDTIFIYYYAFTDDFLTGLSKDPNTEEKYDAYYMPADPVLCGSCIYKRSAQNMMEITLSPSDSVMVSRYYSAGHPGTWLMVGETKIGNAVQQRSVLPLLVGLAAPEKSVTVLKVDSSFFLNDMTIDSVTYRDNTSLGTTLKVLQNDTILEVSRYRSDYRDSTKTYEIENYYHKQRLVRTVLKDM